jgi:hypothetical protein
VEIHTDASPSNTFVSFATWMVEKPAAVVARILTLWGDC